MLELYFKLICLFPTCATPLPNQARSETTRVSGLTAGLRAGQRGSAAAGDQAAAPGGDTTTGPGCSAGAGGQRSRQAGIAAVSS